MKSVALAIDFNNNVVASTLEIFTVHMLLYTWSLVCQLVVLALWVQVSPPAQTWQNPVSMAIWIQAGVLLVLFLAKLRETVRFGTDLERGRLAARIFIVWPAFSMVLLAAGLVIGIFRDGYQVVSWSFAITVGSHSGFLLLYLVLSGSWPSRQACTGSQASATP